MELLITNRKYLRVGGRSVLLWRTPVRVSVSYLFRIKIDGDYLLIRGSRHRTQFQPVGGVYKVHPAGLTFLSSLERMDDGYLPPDGRNADDLRFRIPGKNLVKFLAWFEAARDRELSPWREFCEELVTAGRVNAADFPFVDYDFVRRQINPIRFSDPAQCHELLIADIYEPVLTAVQEKALRELKLGKPSQDLVWVQSHAIERLF
ncbi:MAG TPA: hypothetical protein VGD71_20195, partial [Kribbella sp.]